MTKVTLRKKPITDGRNSLYLDFYPAVPHPDTGKTTRREFLGLYVFNKPRKALEKEHNAETIALGESIRSIRQLDLQAGAYGFLSKRTKNACFVQYFEQLANKRAGTNHDNWHSALAHFKDFAGNTVRMADVTEKFCNDFREYMLDIAVNQRNGEPLAVNTASGYFNKLKATLKQAYSDKLLLFDLNRQIPVIKAEETHRESLELDELRALAQTECAIAVLKQAGLFSALTGLRFSDIHAMTWGQLRPATGGGYNFHFRQVKMKRIEYLPISEEAVTLCGPRGTDDAKVFPELVYSGIHKPLKDWIAAAGVTRHISFHCFRHTHACLQLELGTDLYTVSRLLTHSSIKTTQIYAKVRDKAKRDAANRIKL